MPSVSATYFVVLGLVSAIVLLLLGGAVWTFGEPARQTLAALFAFSASLCLFSACSLNVPSPAVGGRGQVRR
jgi:hypothetical protein